MTWKCPGCNEIYLKDECPTCHMKGGPITWPVPIKVEGVPYLVQRQLRGATTVVKGNGELVLPAERRRVLQAFLAQQHPSV